MRLLFTFLLLAFTAACTAAPTATPTDTPKPLPEASPTAEPLPVTPVESAFAPGDPTAAPLEDILEAHTVSFPAAGGATVTGELYGSGETAVIFSVMGNCKPGWREFAQLTAAQGLLALTYQWHGCRGTGSANETELRQFVDDLRGAIEFVRGQGATRIILAGASLGGCASARLAVESGADGLIVLASPAEIPQWGFAVEAADVDAQIPKLFITAENDHTVPASATMALFDLAAEPKEWQTYPGTAHGTDLFEGESGEALQDRILQFILAVAQASAR